MSKRRVDAKELLECEERFAKGKAVNSILRHVAELLRYDEAKLKDLYERTAWHFDRLAGRKAAAYDIFRAAIKVRCLLSHPLSRMPSQNPNVFDNCTLSEEEKKTLLANIRKRLTPSPVKIRAGAIWNSFIECNKNSHLNRRGGVLLHVRWC